MNAGQLAALIAAGSFAVLVCAAVFVLLRLSRLISAGTRLIADHRARADLLGEQAQAAVEASNEQLARTDAITASVAEVTVGLTELSEQVYVMTGLVKVISAGLRTPVLRAAATVYGIRRAVALRRPAHPAAGPARRAVRR